MSADLSTEHAPLSDFLEGSRPVRLSTDHLAQFHEQGFVSGIPVLNDRQIEALRGELETFLDPQHPGHEYWHEYHSNESVDPERVLFHALGAWRIGRAFHDLLWHPACLGPATQLLDGPVRFWHDQLFCKPARHGGVVAWHQDYSYWTRTRPMAHLTCWIGLDDSTRQNGCLQYVPGSHHWDLLPITGLAGDMDAIRNVLTEAQWERFRKPVAVELKPGECAFHHPLLIHGSFANDTDAPRRAVVLNLVRDGVCSDSSEPLMQGIPVLPPGTPLGGQFFPLLSPREPDEPDQ